MQPLSNQNAPREKPVLIMSVQFLTMQVFQILYILETLVFILLVVVTLMALRWHRIY